MAKTCMHSNSFICTILPSTILIMCENFSQIQPSALVHIDDKRKAYNFRS